MRHEQVEGEEFVGMQLADTDKKKSPRNSAGFNTPLRGTRALGAILPPTHALDLTSLG